MSTIESLLLTLGCVLVVAWLYWLGMREDDAASAGADPWPPELAAASVLYAEKRFATMTPFPLVARIDRLYESLGSLYLMEFKVRTQHRVYRSDIIELSAQRVAFSRSTGRPVSDIAYVCTEVGGVRQTHRVTLLSERELVALNDRRLALLSGREQPRSCEGYALCAHCAYLVECGPGRDAVAAKRAGHVPAAGRHMQH